MAELASTSRSRHLAGLRALESAKGASPRIRDPYAADLATHSLQPTTGAHLEAGDLSAADAQIEAISWVDQQLAYIVDTVDTLRNEEVNQVVLLGDGLDTRPFRLRLPSGLVFYIVASAEAHSIAVAALAKREAATPRGSLVRRVKVHADVDLERALPTAGYRADRPSVWVLEGGVLESGEQLAALALQAAELMSRGSRMLGTLPPWSSDRGVEDLLASIGLLTDSLPGTAGVFAATQLHLSALQQDTYERHSLAAEETDEDFFGNFS